MSIYISRIRVPRFRILVRVGTRVYLIESDERFGTLSFSINNVATHKARVVRTRVC